MPTSCGPGGQLQSLIEARLSWLQAQGSALCSIRLGSQSPNNEWFQVLSLAAFVAAFLHARFQALLELASASAETATAGPQNSFEAE